MKKLNLVLIAILLISIGSHSKVRAQNDNLIYEAQSVFVSMMDPESGFLFYDALEIPLNTCLDDSDGAWNSFAWAYNFMVTHDSESNSITVENYNDSQCEDYSNEFTLTDGVQGITIDFPENIDDTDDDSEETCSDPVACNFGLTESCLYSFSSATFTPQGELMADDQSWVITDLMFDNAPAIGIFEYAGETNLGDSFNNTMYFITLNFDESSGIVEVNYGGNEVFGYTDEVGGFSLPMTAEGVAGINECEGIYASDVADSLSSETIVDEFNYGHYGPYGDDDMMWEEDMFWTCNNCNGYDLQDAETIMGENINLFDGICYELESMNTFPTYNGQEECYTENVIWISLNSDNDSSDDGDDSASCSDDDLAIYDWAWWMTEVDIMDLIDQGLTGCQALTSMGYPEYFQYYFDNPDSELPFLPEEWCCASFGSDTNSGDTLIAGLNYGYYGIGGDDSVLWDPELEWTCTGCNGLDIMDAETIMGINVTVFEGLCYNTEELYIDPIDMNSCYAQSENNVWVGFNHEYVCDDNEDVIITLMTQGMSSDEVDEQLQMINDAGGACNFIMPFAVGDPLIENLCCESLSNFDPSDLCESGDCIQDCYGMWLDHSTIDEFYGNGQCDDFMNCEMLNFDGGDCNAYQCNDPDACNFGEEADCEFPEYFCDCDGNIPNYSNVGWEVDLVAVPLMENSDVHIVGFWHDSLITSEIYVNLEHGWDNTFIGNFDGPPNATFSYYVVVDGVEYGNCYGEPYQIGFNDLNYENPCIVWNNTNAISPNNCAEMYDCNGLQYNEIQWVEEALTLIGNGECESDWIGWYTFNCEEFDYESGDCTPENCNEYIEIDVPIELVEGWSMFGYTCFESKDVVDSFIDIYDKIEIVKDEWGLVYLPDWGFNAIGELQYSKGYQIKMLEQVDGFQFCKTIIRQ